MSIIEAPDLVSQIYASKCPATTKSGTEVGLQNRKRRGPPSKVPEPVRKSRRLQEQQLRKQISSTSLNDIGLQHGDPKKQGQLPSPSPSRTPREGSLNPSTAVHHVGIGNRKQKAEPAIKDIQPQPQVFDEPCRKRLHTGNNTVCSASAASDRIHHWILESRWPKMDFEPDPDMDCPPLKRSRPSSSQGKQSDNGTATPSDQKSRDKKSSPYVDPRYQMLMELKKSYMKDSEAGILAVEKKMCKTLLGTKQRIPPDTLFDNRFFRQTCEKIQNKNETRVIRDIALLITPSAEILATREMKRLDYLVESTNAGWNKSIPFEGPRPQPDYSVGFRYSVFSDDQLKRLKLKFNERTYFAATEEIHFPFLTCELKCGNQALDIADRQNAHSMTVAVRGVVELYRNVERAENLHRKILAISISHDHRNVRIYGHYPEIEGPDTRYYRHLIKEFSIANEDGKDRWAAHQFTRNVYNSFVPMHLDRIKSAVDQLPDPTLESFQSTLSNEDAISSQEMAVTSTSSSQEVGSFKKPAPRKVGVVTTELRAMIQRLESKNEQQREDAKQREERLVAQLEQQRKESEQQRKESAQQRKELMQLLSQQGDQLKQLLGHQIAGLGE
ncbi:MAG: hypothetical protein M1830_001745 [Pleopsidium flavum]|nr:MAG: hypothetical protein M1830_001745 [Pleopsidium flavum]